MVTTPKPHPGESAPECMPYHVYALNQDALLLELDRCYTLADALQTLNDAAETQATAWVLHHGRTVAAINGGERVQL